MTRKIYNKLIRDNIPDIIKANNATPAIIVLSDEDFAKALKKKMVEEAEELLRAGSYEEIVNELSDILQLIESVAENNSIPLTDIEKRKEKKKRERGGFEKRLFLEYVDEP